MPKLPKVERRQAVVQQGSAKARVVDLKIVRDDVMDYGPDGQA